MNWGVDAPKPLQKMMRETMVAIAAPGARLELEFVDR